MSMLAEPWVVLVVLGLLVLGATLGFAILSGRTQPVPAMVAFDQPARARIRAQTLRMGSPEQPEPRPTLHMFSGATVAMLDDLDCHASARKRQTRLYM